jgi:transcriptional regulator with XRE-family HTH domain
MLSKKELISTPEYWIEKLQNEIFRQVHAYMEKEELNQSQLAIRLGVSKGYVSQILNGNFNFTIKKLIELSLSIDILPEIRFKPLSENNNRYLYDTISKSKNKPMVTNVHEDEEGYPDKDLNEFQKESE